MEHIFPTTAKAVAWGSTKIKYEKVFLFWLKENHLLNQNSPLKCYSFQKCHGTSLFIPKGIYKHCTNVCWMYIPAKSTIYSPRVVPNWCFFPPVEHKKIRFEEWSKSSSIVPTIKVESWADAENTLKHHNITHTLYYSSSEAIQYLCVLKRLKFRIFKQLRLCSPFTFIVQNNFFGNSNENKLCFPWNSMSHFSHDNSQHRL